MGFWGEYLRFGGGEVWNRRSNTTDRMARGSMISPQVKDEKSKEANTLLGGGI